jgi:LemA protein
MHAQSMPMLHVRLAAALVAVSLTACGYNSVIQADEEVKGAWAEVQNQYQRRLDLIPNLVATVKGAADFESDTLKEVTEARASAMQTRLDPSAIDDPARLREVEQAQQRVGMALGRFFAGYTEAYPQLQSVAAFRDLQAQLEGTENRIAVARGRFIEAVARYNRIVLEFPTSIGASMRSKQVRPTFEATEGAETAPKVQF